MVNPKPKFDLEKLLVAATDLEEAFERLREQVNLAPATISISGYQKGTSCNPYSYTGLHWDGPLTINVSRKENLK